MKPNERHDLTRWNRAGLREFRYIDANAITHLETLRLQLVEEYDRKGLPSWEDLVERFPELQGETLVQTRKRLSSQYHDERRDYAWEILRTFARGSHVLGEYINAYANEGYLPTAVEWDNVRKLVGMIGYRPSPPASAETHIALLYKRGESGEVGKGFAVKNKPKDGESTVVFETREKLDGGWRLNRLHLFDRDKNRTPLERQRNKRKRRATGPGSADLIRFPLTEPLEDVSIGDLGILAASGHGSPVKVNRLVSSKSDPWIELRLLSAEKNKTGFRRYDTTLFLQPGFVESPLANGEGTALVKKQANLARDEIVFGKDGADWEAMRVELNEHRHVRFSVDHSLGWRDEIHRSLSLNKQNQPDLDDENDVYVLPHGDDGSSGILVDENLNALNLTVQTEIVYDKNGVEADRIYFVVGSHGDRIYYPAKEIAAVIDKVALTEVRFSGKASDFESGDWAFVTHRDKSVTACQIGEIGEEEEWYEVELEGSDKPVLLLRSGFKLALRPRDHDVSVRKAWSSASTSAATVVELQDGHQAKDLRLGQKLICAGAKYAVTVELKDIVKAGGLTRLLLAPPFHLDQKASVLTRHNCALYGNVVRASHGETQPEKIVGNGDASQTRQVFELPSDKISWVADTAFATGVRADLNLRVGQRTWQQVEDLSKSSAEDHHYQVLMNEDGMLSVCFGDGRNGRRLQTGIDNIRASYRTGFGEEGNIEPFALEKIARPHRLVEDFTAPLSSNGGAEKETSESMRDSAPATVLALERAVSLDDFTHLAAHHSMVWQARAFEKVPDRPARPLIEVVIVPAGGEAFSAGSDTARLIRTYLEQHSAPGTPVSVVSYQPVLMDLALSLMVDDTAYDKKQVELAVRDYLESRLALKKRKLGQALFRSEVISLLEAVEGVESGHCTILATPYTGMSTDDKPRLRTADDGGIRRVSVKPGQLLYLDVDAYPLTVTIEPYGI